MKKILFLSFILFGINVHAQEQSDLEYFLGGAQVMDITSDGSNLWFATNGNGIFKYIPKTNVWMQYSTSFGNLQHDFFYCIAANEDYVWASSNDGFLLEKNGKRFKGEFAFRVRSNSSIRNISFTSTGESIREGLVAKNQGNDFDRILKIIELVLQDHSYILSEN